MLTSRCKGRLAATATIAIWGTTFISTKLLLPAFLPIEILALRFTLGIVCLSLLFPRRLRVPCWRQEALFIAAGACGVFLYYLLENIALTHTLASNVGVIMCVSPFFSALLESLSGRGCHLRSPYFLAGAAIATTGICLIGFNEGKVELSPSGDLLALLAAAVWACYSELMQKISGHGYPVALATRRIFCWGVLMMAPLAILQGDMASLPGRLANPSHVFNLVFLGAGASALCFVSWNYALRALGAVRVSLYIYATPVITIVTAMIVLGEKLTPWAMLGCALALAGLALSQKQEKGA